MAEHVSGELWKRNETEMSCESSGAGSDHATYNVPHLYLCPPPCLATGCCRCWSDYDRQRQRASVSAFADNVDGANRCNSHLPQRQIVASRRHALPVSLSLFRQLIWMKWKLIRSLEMISRCEAHCRERRMRREDSSVQGKQTEWRLVQEGSRQLTDPM